MLTTPRGESYRFDSGAVALDFGYSGGVGQWAVFETLHTADDLRAWVSEPPLAVTLAAAPTADELAAAKAVRHAIIALFFARAVGAELPGDALDVVNAAARRPPLAPQMAVDGVAGSNAARVGGGTGGVGVVRRWATPVAIEQVVSTLAREAIEILTGPLAERVRACAADDCPLVFVDTSRPGTRRWCSMERCGNRHKLRTYRSRRQDAG